MKNELSNEKINRNILSVADFQNYKRTFSHIKQKLFFSTSRKKKKIENKHLTKNSNTLKLTQISLKNNANLRPKLLDFKFNSELIQKIKLLIKSIHPNRIATKENDETIIERFLEFFQKVFEKIPHFQKVISTFNDYLFLPITKKSFYLKKTKLKFINNRICYREAYNNLEHAFLALKFNFEKIKKKSKKLIANLKKNIEVFNKKQLENKESFEALTKIESLRKKEMFDLIGIGLGNSFKIIEMKKFQKSMIGEYQEMIIKQEFQEFKNIDLEQKLKKAEQNFIISNDKIVLLVKNNENYKKEIWNLKDTISNIKARYNNFTRKLFNLKKVISNPNNITSKNKKEKEDSHELIKNFLLMNSNRSNKFRDNKRTKFNSFKLNVPNDKFNLLESKSEDENSFEENNLFLDNIDQDVVLFLNDNEIEKFDHKTQKILLEVFYFLLTDFEL